MYSFPTSAFTVACCVSLEQRSELVARFDGFLIVRQKPGLYSIDAIQIGFHMLSTCGPIQDANVTETQYKPVQRDRRGDSNMSGDALNGLRSQQIRIGRESPETLVSYALVVAECTNLFVVACVAVEAVLDYCRLHRGNLVECCQDW